MKAFDALIVTTHVAPACGYGGVAESGAALSSAWAQDGHAVGLVSSDASVGGAISVADVGLKPPCQAVLYRSRAFRRWGFGWGALLAIPAGVRRSRAVYVNGIATWPTTLGAASAMLLRRRTVIALRGGLMRAHVDIIRTRKAFKWLFYRLIALPLLKRAAAIHATSELEAAEALALLPHAKIVVIANGVDLARWRPAPAKRARTFTLLYLGRISPEKGILAFARLWPQMAEPGERLIIAGSGNGDYAAQLATLAAAYPDCIELAGLIAREEVPALLAQADVLVLPSGMEGGDIRENFGNSAAEALACGVPILTVRGLAWDRVESASAGFLFDPNAASAASAVAKARAASVAATLDPMRRAARAFAERELSLEMTARRLWAVVTGEDEPERAAENTRTAAMGAP